MDEGARTADVQRAAAGDPDALQRLIVEYHSAWRAAVEQAIGADRPARLEPDDILQRAYAAAFGALCPGHEAQDSGGALSHRPRFDNPEGFYRWIETIALHALQDEQRALRRHKLDVGREQGPVARGGTTYYDLALTLVASDGTPSRILAKREAEAAVLSSLARLGRDQRAVIRLRFLEGRPVGEVAEQLGKTEAAIHMLCHRGLKALREHLESLSGYRTPT